MKLAQDIIIKPIITEKSMDVLAQGKYTFKVAKDSIVTISANPTKLGPDGKKRKDSIEFFENLI